MKQAKILIFGCSDVGTACALRLHRAGFSIVMAETARPADLYHSRTFSSAVFMGYRMLNGIKARTFANVQESGRIGVDATLHEFIKYQLAQREIALITLQNMGNSDSFPVDFAVITDPAAFNAAAANLTESAVCIAIGPPQPNCVYSIATDTVNFGQVVYPFMEQDQPQISPAEEPAQGAYTVKAPLEGVFTTMRAVNESVLERDELGRIDQIPILSPVSGRISGLLNSGMIIKAKTVFAEIASTHSEPVFHRIPKEAFCLAGAVLEAIMYHERLQSR
jgi:xanthine dehydrogenase accessory factor